ncbi:Major facilitator superfamily domain general substrate transporter [Fusarium albosuccineum]|uniref:Major facilitator superfamily domain general substrate transporter n=1 Tax=Fusarium albosuccineum TaxID=1237068 RepID=A0A8H4PA66_9HYPO|nr:Major facilitator superfamily domain general substrate transporter [Fusarium albosuccineum]
MNQKFEDKLSQFEETSLSRQNLPRWKWAGTFVTIYLTSIINGFDVSNVANIQPRLYEELGHIELLPWIGLSYSLANFAALPLARKILHFTDICLAYPVGIVIFSAGAATAGAAQGLSTIIAGRVVMGVGGSICQHCATSYLISFPNNTKVPILYAGLSGVWAVGLAVGGPIGSAFSENTSLTWRWAFYINLPFLGLACALAVICLPKNDDLVSPLERRRVTKADAVGITASIAATALFAIAVTFPGPMWKWDSGATIATWTIFGVTLVSVVGWMLRGHLTTAPDWRGFVAHVLGHREFLLVWIASACAGVAYAVTLYYMPLFFAFARGLGALEQTVRMLPFIFTFIATVFAVGAYLPKLGWYKAIYVGGGVVTLAAGTALALILEPETPESTAMGLTALVGFGLGLHFQHGTAISNVLIGTTSRGADNVAVFNMALMGGISMSLVIAGAIYENRGFSLLSSVLESGKYNEKEIREALSGVSSTVWRSSDPRVVSQGIKATADVISFILYMITSSGAICFICGLCMKWDKLDYNRSKTG